MVKENIGEGDKLLERLKHTSAKGRQQEFLEKDVLEQIEELENLLENNQDRIIELSFKREWTISRISFLNSTKIGRYGDLDKYLEEKSEERKKKRRIIPKKSVNYIERNREDWDPKELNAKLEKINLEIVKRSLRSQMIEEEIEIRKDVVPNQEIPVHKWGKEKNYIPSILYDKTPPRITKAVMKKKRKQNKGIDFLLKICILGKKDTGVSRWFMNFKPSSYVLERWMLYGYSFSVKSIKLEDKKFKFQIWFLNPYRRSYGRHLKTLFFRGSSGAFLVYDITSPESLSSIPEWINLIREECGDIPIFLLGNNCELEELQELTKKQTEYLIEKFNLTGKYEISITEDINLDLPFQKISEYYFKKYFNKPTSSKDMLY
jgi:Ras-related protein Rab-11A